MEREIEDKSVKWSEVWMKEEKRKVLKMFFDMYWCLGCYVVLFVIGWFVFFFVDVLNVLYSIFFLI